MKNLFNLKSIVQRNARWLLTLFAISIFCVVQVQADDWEAVWQAYLKCDFNGTAKKFGTTGDDSKDYEYTYNASMSGDADGILYDLGTLDADNFVITYLSWMIADNWDCKNTYSYMWYQINGGEATHSTGQHWTGQNNTTGYYPKSEGISWTIARYTDASGVYVFTNGFYTHFHWDDKGYRQADLNNGGSSYKFKYRVAPPAVDTIYVTSNALAGDGSYANPYIVAYGEPLQIDITSAVQAHTDANSSAQYSIDNENWGTATSNTRKTTSGVTSTELQNWMVYARFHNGTASLTGAQKERRVYYRAENRYNITATASPVAGGTVTPVSATITGENSGGDITATPYVGYKFNGWSIASGSGYFGTSGTDITSSTANTKFRPSAESTVQAAFIHTYAYIEGRFQIYNAARNAKTTTYTSGGQWASESTNIQMEYESANKRFALHTYMTPAELSANHGDGCDDCTPYFYIVTSTSSSSLANTTTYWSSVATTITASNSKVSLTHTGDLDNDNLRINSTDESGYVVLYFDETNIWYELELATFTGDEDTDWDNTDNWMPKELPSSDRDVIISAPVVVNSTDAVAKSITIGASGSISINADAKLVVEETITGNGAGGETTASDIFIDSNSGGNGTLIWGTEGSIGKATVAFYTKSHGTGTTDDVNQYIGTPFSDESNNYNYYGAWVFAAKSDMSAWERLPMGTGMDPFVGYNVIYNSAEAGHVFVMDGTLNSNEKVTCSCSSNSYGNENLLANSWVAPIDMSKFEATDFIGVTFAIYIFNSTSEKASAENKTATGGNYTTYTLATSGTIPSMQSFSVCGSGSVTLNYNRLVKGGNVTNGAMHAPSRDKRAEMNSLTVQVGDDNGWGDELKLFEHEDFSMDFENGWDAPKMIGYPQAPQMYAVSTDGNMAINCVPTFEDQIIGFHAGTAANEYKMTFVYDGDEELYLKDTKTNSETLISSESSYTFTTDSNDSDMRFVIRKAPAVVTGIDDLNANGNVQKIMHDGALYIVREGRIYDATGTLVK